MLKSLWKDFAVAMKAGDPRARESGKRGGRPRKSETATRYAEDMRWVYGHPDTNCSGARKLLQERMRDSPRLFMSEMAALERQQAEGPANGPAMDGAVAGKPEVDEGAQRVGELVGRLLDEWEAQNAASGKSEGNRAEQNG